MSKIKNNIFKIVIIVSCVFALIGLFLPYESSTKEHREYLDKYPDTMYVEEVNLKNKDVKDISIIENFKVYSYAMNHSDGNDWVAGESIINFVITIVLIVSIALVLLFAILNKNIPVIIFDFLMAGSSLLMNYDIVDRGVIPSDNYSYGISYFLYIILAIIILIMSILLIIKKKKNENSKIEEKETEKENKNEIVIEKSNNQLIAKIKSLGKGPIIGIIVGLVVIIALIVVIINLAGQKPSNNDNSNSSTTDTSEKSDIKDNNTSTTNVKASTYKELDDAIEKDTEDTIKELESSYNNITKEIDTVEKYNANKDKIKQFYADVVSKNKATCIRIREYALKYGQLIINSKKDFDDMYDDTDNINDKIYDGALDELQKKIYDGILDDMMDFYYDGILDDSDDWDLQSDEYNLVSDAQSDVYDDISDAQSDIYDFYSDLGSDLYDEDLSKAQETINKFQEDINKLK